MINIMLPYEYKDALSSLTEVIRRAPDCTVLPLFVDYNNFRVIIGAIAASSSNIGKLEVTGDIKLIGAGNGLLLPSRDGTKLGRLILENPDNFGNLVLSVDRVI